MASVPGAAGPGAGYPQWSYNTFSHQVAEVPNEFAKAAAEAATFPNKLIFFTSQQAADNYMASQGGGNDTSHTILQTGANAASAAGQAAVNAGKGWTALVSGFSGTNFVLRAVKIIVGGMLLLIGLSHLTGADNAVMVAARNVKVPV